MKPILTFSERRWHTLKLTKDLHQPLSKKIIIVRWSYSISSVMTRNLFLKEVPAYAEKVRAALTIRVPAIRDFFDLLYVDRKKLLNFLNPDFLKMVKVKIDVPGNDPTDVSTERKQELNRQLAGQLKPVLRPKDFDGFNLEEAFQLVSNIAEALSV